MSQILHNKTFIPDIMKSNCRDAIADMVKEDNTGKFVIIVPTGKIVRYYSNMFIKEYYQKKGKPFTSGNIFTFQKFVKYCFDSIFNQYDYHLISDAYRLSVFEEASQKAGLKFFKKKQSDKMSYALLKKLSEVIIGLKEDGIKPAHLENDINDTTKYKTDLNRITDIYALYKSYQELLGNYLLDFPDLLELTTEKLNGNKTELFKQIFHENQIIILDGFTEFKVPEIEFLRLFSDSSIPISVNIEYDDYQGPLYTILENSINELINAGFIVTENNNEKNNKTSKLNFLKHNLFNINEISDSRFSKNIKIIETSTAREEVKYLTKLIKYLLLIEKYETSDICIALRHPESYSSLFRDEFMLNKIPVNISDRFQLDKSPVIVAVFAMVELLRRGFRIDDLKKSLKNPYLTLNDSNERIIDYDNLISMAIKLKIIGGSNWGGSIGWIRRLSQKKEFLEARLALLSKDMMADEFENTMIRNEINSLSRAIDDFQFIISKLPVINKKYTPKEFSSFLKKDILSRFSIKDNIKNRINIREFMELNINKQEKTIVLENIEKDARAFSALIEIIDEMENVLTNRNQNMYFETEELLDRLKTAITEKKYQINEKSGFGVTITTIEQTRQIPYKVMFLCGANDGEFPTPYIPEVFLGKELPETEQRHILSERMQFFQFLTNSPELLETDEKKIFISYPKFQEDTELVRSPFVDALLAITTIENDGNIINVQSVVNSNSLLVNPANIWINSVSTEFEQQRIFSDFILKGTKDAEIFSELKFEDEIKEQIKDFLSFIKRGNYKNVRIAKESLPAEISNYFEKKAGSAVSVTELEEYAKCPYRYFLGYLLKLKEPEDLEISISSLEMGNILHKILFEFYTETALKNLESGLTTAYKPINAKIQSIIPVQLNPQLKADYQKRLLELAKTYLEQIKFDHPLFAVDEEIIIGSNGNGGLLNIWLNAEIGRISNNWNSTPSLFEFAFGMKSYSNLDSPFINIDGLKIKGKIDRIELNTNENVFLISDYKLSGGALPSLSKVKDGKAFQIPIYLLAAKQILKDSYNLDLSPAGGIYYIFKSNNKISGYKLLLVPKNYQLMAGKNLKNNIEDSDMLEEILADSLISAKAIIEKIGNGNFDVMPDNGACTYCKFASICRIDKF